VVENARSNTEDEAWRNKVRSLDDTLKALRNGTAKSMSKPKEKDQKPAREPGHGIFGGLHGRPSPQVVPIEPSHQS
jgi:hypothetical protein